MKGTGEKHQEKKATTFSGSAGLTALHPLTDQHTRAHTHYTHAHVHTSTHCIHAHTYKAHTQAHAPGSATHTVYVHTRVQRTLHAGTHRHAHTCTRCIHSQEHTLQTSVRAHRPTSRVLTHTMHTCTHTAYTHITSAHVPGGDTHAAYTHTGTRAHTACTHTSTHCIHVHAQAHSPGGDTHCIHAHPLHTHTHNGTYPFAHRDSSTGLGSAVPFFQVRRRPHGAKTSQCRLSASHEPGPTTLPPCTLGTEEPRPRAKGKPRAHGPVHPVQARGSPAAPKHPSLPRPPALPGPPSFPTAPLTMGHTHHFPDNVHKAGF